MIRHGAEIQNAVPIFGARKKSNGFNGDFYDDGVNHDMELDE